MGGAGDVGPPRGEDEDRGGDGEHEQAPGDAGDLERGGEGLARVGGQAGQTELVGGRHGRAEGVLGVPGGLGAGLLERRGVLQVRAVDERRDAAEDRDAEVIEARRADIEKTEAALALTDKNADAALVSIADAVARDAWLQAGGATIRNVDIVGGNHYLAGQPHLVPKAADAIAEFAHAL